MTFIDRVILSTIRNLGGCPCPRCLIPLARADLSGTSRDNQQRITLSRVDDHTRQWKIQNARRLIYEDNRAVDSAPVQHLLKPESLVPTEVRIPTATETILVMTFQRTHFQCDCRNSDSTYSPFLCQILCTK